MRGVTRERGLEGGKEERGFETGLVCKPEIGVQKMLGVLTGRKNTTWEGTRIRRLKK